MESYNNLQPTKVFKYFKEISDIPRGSGNEKAVSDYLVKFAQDRGLEVVQDKALNVVIKKPATAGYENGPTVILQGHMDMVCEKNNDKLHDFEKDPIELIVDDGYIRANDTTLGADNGIAVAYALAVLDSDDIEHPNLEILVTTEEETGMGGVINLEAENLSGTIIINMDSEEEGIFTASCAGGIRNRINIPLEFTDLGEDFMGVKVFISGLKGGHSGMDINKERGNANKIMGRVLNILDKKFDYYLGDINGGSKMNAIPRESEALLFIKSEDQERFLMEITEIDSMLAKELEFSDTVFIKAERVETNLQAMTKKTTKMIVKTLLLIPNGIKTMSMAVKDLVQSSTNLGVIKREKNKICLESAIRSSVKSLKYAVVDELTGICEIFGYTYENSSDYPQWEFAKESYIRDLCVSTYEEITGKKAEIFAIHAGLECGFLGEKLSANGHIDMISMGPNMHDVHTPQERLEIESTRKTYEFLLELLKRIK
ncbi:MAG: aminoacyl-histidine dipeptidase [Firmicutes bacterium]|jgi:dipeptidase D|nr:aminoacyl-histidine dipeptidase [Bacillota bacterium]